MASDLFSGVSFDLSRFRSDMRRTGARRDYAIFFTPRSGSSWLTDVLSQTRRLGRPEEWFNPTFVPRIAQSVNADNLVNYVKMLRRKQAPGEIFGLEITYYQIAATCGGEDSFLSLFAPQTTSFFLVRKDIVLQAVSLAKSVTSSVYHSVNAPPEEISRADADFRYDARTIRFWLKHILDQERRFEDFFQRHGISPLRLSYERMIGAGRAATVDVFSKCLGVMLSEAGDEQSRHTKIGTDKNTEFAVRFAAEQSAYLDTVAKCRERTLGLLEGEPQLPDRARSDSQRTTVDAR